MGIGAGCTGADADASGSAPSTRIAEVDRMEVPNRIDPSDTLTVRLLGMVGPNGCYSLGRVTVERASQRVQIMPLVNQVRRQDAMCTMAIVPLDETVRLDPPFAAGTLSIVVPQSEGPAVTATVEVAEATE